MKLPFITSGLSYFKSCGEYISSHSVTLGYKDVYLLKGKLMSLEHTETFSKIIPLRKVFTVLFNKPGVFKETQNYVDRIRKSET